MSGTGAAPDLQSFRINRMLQAAKKQGPLLRSGVSGLTLPACSMLVLGQRGVERGPALPVGLLQPRAARPGAGEQPSSDKTTRDHKLG